MPSATAPGQLVMAWLNVSTGESGTAQASQAMERHEVMARALGRGLPVLQETMCATATRASRWARVLILPVVYPSSTHVSPFQF